MSEQYIEVQISNQDLAEIETDGRSMINYILDRLTTAGIPVKPYKVGCAINVETGALQYNRNAMNSNSVYTWMSEDYYKEHGG